MLARLRGIQVALAKNPSAFLYSLERQLTRGYNTILHQEYLFWSLKSRIMWLNYGDANTKYFHLKTIQRRSHSQVVTLKDDTGLWLTSEPLTQHIYTTFKKLFQATSPHQCPSSRTDRQFCPNSPFFNLAQDLARIPHPKEIVRTLQELPPLKGPRTGWIPCALLPNKLVKFRPKHHSGHSSHPYTAHSPSKLG